MFLLLLASLTFVKSFPGSVPDYYRIVLQENGDAIYATAADDPRPVEFKVSAETAKQAFDLAAKLNHFKGETLESPRKVAFMGKKTFLWDDAGKKSEVSFNFSERPEAAELSTLFEHIGNTQEVSLELQRLMRFDKLGLMKYLLQTEIRIDSKELADPELLAPVLLNITTNKTYMDICRQRAKIIMGKIETPATTSKPPKD